MASFLLDQYANSGKPVPDLCPLKQAFGSLNPSDPAAHDAVLVGHSMGGIISRLLVSDADITKPALEMMTIRQQNRFKKHPMVTERLQMHSISNFDRAIFLASPHRGTDYADRWFTLAARKIIRLPGAFYQLLQLRSPQKI